MLPLLLSSLSPRKKTCVFQRDPKLNACKISTFLTELLTIVILSLPLKKSQDIIATPCSSPFVTHAFTSVYIQSSEPSSPSRYKTSPSRPPAAPPHFNERLHTLLTTGNAVPAAVSWQEHHPNGIAPRAAFRPWLLSLGAVLLSPSVPWRVSGCSL